MCRRAADSPSLPPSTAPPTRASLALPGDGRMQSLPLPLASFREVFTVNTRTHPLKGERRQIPSNFALGRQLQIVQMCVEEALSLTNWLFVLTLRRFAASQYCGRRVGWDFLIPPPKKKLDERYSDVGGGL